MVQYKKVIEIFAFEVWYLLKRLWRLFSVVPIEGLMQAILVQEHKDKIINTMVHEVLLSMDEREFFHYTINNIIDVLYFFIPYTHTLNHKHPHSTLSVSHSSFTSLFISYNLYKHVFIL